MATSAPIGPLWAKTSAPRVHQESRCGRYRLSLRFTSSKGRKPKKKLGTRMFGTREEADAAAHGFRLSWEQGRRGKLIDPAMAHPATSSASSASPLPAGPAGESCHVSCVFIPCERDTKFKIPVCFWRQRREGVHHSSSYSHGIAVLCSAAIGTHCCRSSITVVAVLLSVLLGCSAVIV